MTSRAPNAAVRNKRDKDTFGAKATEAKVHEQLAENFPRKAIRWVRDGVWRGPVNVPLEAIDWHDMREWSAYKEPDRVRHFEKLIRDKEKINPVVVVKVPRHDHYRIVDGHHRSLAYRNLGLPVRAWTGLIPARDVAAAEETHSSQEHQGAQSGNE